MKLYLTLAWRNLWRHRRRTLIVVSAIGLTLAMMMMYDGLIAGFEQAIYGNAIKVLGGNVQIHAAGFNAKEGKNPLLPLPNDQEVVKAAEAAPNVVAATRRINTGGLATNKEGAFAVTISGIEPEKERPLSVIADNVKSGRYLSSADQDVVLIGKGLATAMDLKVGDRFTLAGRATHEQMRSRTMTVGGIYDLGIPNVEKRTVYVSLPEAQDLYGLTGQTTEVVLTLKQIGQEATVMKALKPALAGYEMDSWETNYPDLQSAIGAKGGVMNIFGVIIFIIAGIGILNLLLMAVFERIREIGLLGAVGFKPRQISWLFLLEGALMGLVGVAAGVVMGLAFNYIYSKVGFDYSQFSSVSSYTALISGKVYSTLGTEKLLQRVVTAVIIATLAAYYPAHEAAQKDPAAALHTV